MARWRLMTQHYLEVPGVEWEQVQISQETGKQVRYRHKVPQLLNPEDPSDWNYSGDKMIVVCHEDKGLPRDITFFGNPTPDMEPMDEEAMAISESLQDKWKHPIDSLQAQGGFGEVLMKDLQKQLEAALRNAATAVAAPAQPVSLGGVDPAAFAALQAQVQQLLEQNMALQAKAAGVEPELNDLELREESIRQEIRDADARVERRA